MEKMGCAEYWQYVENQEIDNAIATLERIQKNKNKMRSTNSTNP